MNVRKFTLIASAILMFFLFIAGTVVLNNLGSTTVSASGEEKSSSGFQKIFEEIVIKQKPVNILVLGGDKVNSNTDTLMLVNYDPSTTKANIVSIPRDTKVYIEENVRKINFAYPHGGAKLAVETVTGLLGVNIKYYIYIDTSVFRKIIDKLGGIKNFYVPQNLNYDDDAQNLHIHLKKGYQDLDGDKAEQFMRYRGYNRKVTDFYDGSDIKRIKAQQSLLSELIKQKANISYIHKFNDVVMDIFDSLETNMKLSEVLKMAQNITDFKYENISFYTLPGTDGYEDGISYYFLDREKSGELLTQYFSAEEGFDGVVTVPGSYSDIYKVKEAEDKVKSNNSKKNTTKKNDYSKNNPSNSETNIKKDPKPKP